MVQLKGITVDIDVRQLFGGWKSIPFFSAFSIVVIISSTHIFIIIGHMKFQQFRLICIFRQLTMPEQNFNSFLF